MLLAASMSVHICGSLLVKASPYPPSKSVLVLQCTHIMLLLLLILLLVHADVVTAAIDDIVIAVNLALLSASAYMLQRKAQHMPACFSYVVHLCCVVLHMVHIHACMMLYKTVFSLNRC